MSMGRWIYARMLRLDMSARDLAEITGIARSRVNDLVMNRGTPSKKEMEAFSRVFDTAEDELGLPEPTPDRPSGEVVPFPKRQE